MPEKYQVKHLDSNIIIGAFFPDEKDLRRDVDDRCRRFLFWILKNERNTKLRMSLVSYGEVLHKMLCCEQQEDMRKGYKRFKKYADEMGERFELYSPKLKGDSENIDRAISVLKDKCEQIRNSDADALILAYAMVDKEASSIYSLDSYLLNSVDVDDAVRAFRKERQMRRLMIKPVNEHDDRDSG